MGGRFGKPRSAPAATVNEDDYDRAMLDLKVARDKVRKYQNMLDNESEVLRAKARELAKAGRLESAKTVLRAKKRKEIMVEKAEKMLNNVQQQIDSMEQAKMSMEVMNQLKSTNDVLKQMNEMMPVEEVERLMDENEEHAERLREVQDALARDMSPQEIEVADEEYEALLAEINMGEPAKQPQPEEPQPEQEDEPEEEEAEQPERVAVPA